MTEHSLLDASVTIHARYKCKAIKYKSALLQLFMVDSFVSSSGFEEK